MLDCRAWWLCIVALGVAGCSRDPPQTLNCQALNAPRAVVDRCFGGNLERGVYVGDLRCWPFSEPRRLHGLWLVGPEASEFYPNAATLQDVKYGGGKIWLASDLLQSRPELVAASQGAGTRVYVVGLEGREALCDGMFGHFGQYPRQIIADRVFAMRPLDAPKS